jgi:hypothetical protein
VTAELAARRTAAAAVLGDFRRADAAFFGSRPRTAPQPDYSDWGARLATELASLLRRLEAEAAEAAPFLVAAHLAAVRVVLEAFDWETGDRQYALEQIDAIVRGDGS